MKKFIIIFLLILLTGCSETVDDKITIAVSIVPQERFVKKVAGDLVDVVVMIPPGNSPTNYQPSPKEMMDFDSSDLYFSIGVSAEQSYDSSDVTEISLSDIVNDIYEDRYFSDHDESGRDPHIWLSPKRVILMVETIRDELINLDNDNKEIYTSNAGEYIKELNELDLFLKDKFKELNNNSFIIYHPSYGYFSDDYGLEMITIEVDGKESTAKMLENVIDYANENDIKFILYQEEFDSEQAKLVANNIDGTVIKVAPLSEDYIENLRYIGKKLEEILE